MDYDLQPITDVGKRFVELAEKHAVDFAPRAAEHDRAGTFPTENIDELKASGFAAATVPAEFGGMGLESVHDLMVGLNRIARADASTAIAINMHLAVGWVSTWAWRVAKDIGREELRTNSEGFLGMLPNLIVLVNGTEAGGTLGWPLTELTPTDGGYLLNGKKIFGTLSPVADAFLVLARIARKDGDGYDSGIAVVFRGSAGQQINDDWDALGMRASGSGSVDYTDCFVPESLVIGRGRWGEFDHQAMAINSAGNAGLIASFLGVAEAAASAAITMATTRRKAPSGNLVAEQYGIQHATAEMRTALATSRGLLDRIGRILDDTFVNRATAAVEMDELHRLLAEFQAVKLASNAACIAAVDKAMQISGGAGYFASNPLSRHYRDVRAGPFMQVYSPNEAYEYIGKVTLGLPT